jgi:hypothetical protein
MTPVKLRIVNRRAANSEYQPAVLRPLAGNRLAHDKMALALQDATVSAGRTASP